MFRSTYTVLAVVLLTMIWVSACGPREASAPQEEEVVSQAPMPNGILVSLAVLDKDADGKPVPQPARMGILTSGDKGWTYRYLEDSDSNVLHKAMAYGSVEGAPGLLTFGGTRAAVKLLHPGEDPQVIWEEDFGGKFSRMRDGEVADIYGDGMASIAVATHDQGVVAVLRPDSAGGFTVEELDREGNTFVHEIEIGDLTGDGTLEIYATPSEPNKMDGTPQPGKVVRYIPAVDEGRTVVADLGDRHAKEILVADIDGDGTDELYVSVEAVSGGDVEIRRYDADTDPTGGKVIATLDDTLCRFLTAGDIDGDGNQEMVAAAFKSGLWLLRPGQPAWSVESIDKESSGFEHAAILTDLDEDGVDELYVASDRDSEIRRYVWRDGKAERQVIHRHTDGLSRFTWNLMPAAVDSLP
ncbi:MAG: VCBS repeat-containing protein [Thermoanaerobaculia bacterium]